MQQFKANYQPMEENIAEEDDEQGSEQAQNEQPEDKDFGKAYQKLVK